MSPKQFNPRLGLLVLIIVGAGAARVLNTAGHLPLSNFTPIGAMALFGGAYFTDQKKAFGLPLLSLWISDLLLNYLFYYHEWRWFYDGFYWTYGCFALMVLLGQWMIRKISLGNIVLASVMAALLHYLITDFGVWMEGRMYPHHWRGLIACYVAALPYLKNMLIGNLLYSALLFGLFEWSCGRFKSGPVTHQSL